MLCFSCVDYKKSTSIFLTFFIIFSKYVKNAIENIKSNKTLTKEEFSMTNMFKELSNRDKIAFIEFLNWEFSQYYERNPVAMELYFTQIITIIDTILGDIFLSPESSRLAKIANFLSPEVLQLTKLSNDTMVMIVTKTQSSLSVPLEIAQRSSLSVPLEIAQRSSQSAPIALLGSRMSAPRE